MKYLLVFIIILFTNTMRSQMRHSKEDLERLRQEADSVKNLGRQAIIDLAAKAICDDPEMLYKDENVNIRVWYNDLEVKVEFRESSTIRYLPYAHKYLYEKSVRVGVDKVSDAGRCLVSNLENDSLGTKAPFYRNTSDKKAIIDKVRKPNNANKDVPPIPENPAPWGWIIIRDRKDHYAIQLGKTYSTTYKIDKKSGKVYDFKDPYRGFYPTPYGGPTYPPPLGGEWIEMKDSSKKDDTEEESKETQNFPRRPFIRQ